MPQKLVRATDSKLSLVTPKLSVNSQLKRSVKSSIKSSMQMRMRTEPEGVERHQRTECSEKYSVKPQSALQFLLRRQRQSKK